MTPTIASWLVALSDPQTLRELPGRLLDAVELGHLMDLADRHGVLPAVAENLRQLKREDRLGQLIIGDNPQAVDVQLHKGREMLTGRVGLALALRMQLRKVAAALADAGLPVIVLKGTDFADRLYKPGMRLFSDIDLLTSQEAFDQAATVIRLLGYRQTDQSAKYSAGYGEETFSPLASNAPGSSGDAVGGNVELHWNLVNSPTVRRGISVCLADLVLEDQPLARPLRAASPSSQLLIASVHAAASHGFDRLQLLWDIVQIVRKNESLDEDYLRHATKICGAHLAMAAALRLAGKLLHEPKCGQLAGRLGLKPSRLASMAITSGVVLRQHAWADSFRRQIFRAMLKNGKKMAPAKARPTA
jgi:hypothetical protein